VYIADLEGCVRPVRLAPLPERSRNVLDKGLPGAVAVLALALLTLWFVSSRGVPTLAERVPGMDRSGPDAPPPEVDLRGTFIKGDGVATDLPGLWPWFRGPERDNLSTEPTPLAKSFPADGPKVLWSVALGYGYAGPAVRAGRVYLLDYDQPKKADALRCLSLADGKEIWRRSYPVEVKFNHGMSRTIPAVTEKFVVSLGPKAHVLCVDATTGDFRWGLDLVREYKAVVPGWYAGQCPLIDGERVILAVGGQDVLLMAVDLATGKPVWRTPNPANWLMTHASILPMTFRGRRMLVYTGSNPQKGTGGIVGVSADDGRVLWQSNAFCQKIVAPTPLRIGEDLLLFTAGYNAGSLILRLKQDGERITPEVVKQIPAKEFGSDQQTPLFFQDHVFSVIPNGQLVCLKPTGERVWASGPGARFGLGPYLVAGGIIYLLNDSGVLTLAEATPAGYRPLGQWEVVKGHDAWGPMALVGGRLLARDLSRMVCLDVSAQGLGSGETKP
jgi:outer membrane protein assembly factor BamB